MAAIGRFLEHSRVFYYRNGAEDPVDGAFYIGSADWMNRNLSGRVEAVSPIDRRPLRERLWEILQTLLRDSRQAWLMKSDGSYRKPDPAGEADVGTHQALMNLARSESIVTPEELSLLR
jgi:polyphosphate kinase